MFLNKLQLSAEAAIAHRLEPLAFGQTFSTTSSSALALAVTAFSIALPAWTDAALLESVMRQECDSCASAVQL